MKGTQKLQRKLKEIEKVWRYWKNWIKARNSNILKKNILKNYKTVKLLRNFRQNQWKWRKNDKMSQKINLDPQNIRKMRRHIIEIIKTGENVLWKSQEMNNSYKNIEDHYKQMERKL